MKALLTSTAALLFALGASAQNKQVQSETKTTVTTVKDSDGAKQFVKKENVQQTQDIKFQDDGTNSLNKRTVDTPVQVTATTQITNPDGTTRTVDVDRSSVYTYNGQEYKVALDNTGYSMTTGNMKPARLRKTSINTYIYRTGDRTSIGYFDTDGNLVLETYDDKSDKVNVEKYIRVVK